MAKLKKKSLVLIGLVVFLLGGCDFIQHVKIKIVDGKRILYIGNIGSFHDCKASETSQQCEDKFNLKSFKQYLLPDELPEVIETRRLK